MESDTPFKHTSKKDDFRHPTPLECFFVLAYIVACTFLILSSQFPIFLAIFRHLINR